MVLLSYDKDARDGSVKYNRPVYERLLHGLTSLSSKIMRGYVLGTDGSQKLKRKVCSNNAYFPMMLEILYWLRDEKKAIRKKGESFEHQGEILDRTANNILESCFDGVVACRESCVLLLQDPEKVELCEYIIKEILPAFDENKLPVSGKLKNILIVDWEHIFGFQKVRGVISGGHFDVTEAFTSKPQHFRMVSSSCLEPLCVERGITTFHLQEVGAGCDMQRSFNPLRKPNQCITNVKTGVKGEMFSVNFREGGRSTPTELEKEHYSSIFPKFQGDEFDKSSNAFIKALLQDFGSIVCENRAEIDEIFERTSRDGSAKFKQIPYVAMLSRCGVGAEKPAAILMWLRKYDDSPLLVLSSAYPLLCCIDGEELHHGARNFEDLLRERFADERSYKNVRAWFVNDHMVSFLKIRDFTLKNFGEYGKRYCRLYGPGNLFLTANSKEDLERLDDEVRQDIDCQTALVEILF